MLDEDLACEEKTRSGSANGNRTRILALKGLRANRCTIAPLPDYILPSSPAESHSTQEYRRQREEPGTSLPLD